MESKPKKQLVLFISLVFTSFILLSFSKLNQGYYSDYSSYHSKGISALSLMDLPDDTNALFSGSGNCVLCHGDPNQFPSSSANLDSNGNDVSPVSLWRASMMANAAIDPFWRAKVKHEGLENPSLVEEIETLCTTCHATNGHFNAMHTNLNVYTINNLENDPLGLDGVSCNSCHMMENVNFGSTFSGDITYNENHVEYGQYQSPFQNPMINNSGFTPEYGEHISKSEACGKCHSLITETINNDGELTGNSFVEQSVYHEWLNSNYSVNEIECIDCHMTRLEQEIKLSPMPPWLGTRSPFSRHDIVGGNVFMLNLLKENSESLNVNASDVQFDSIIAQTTIMLQQRALNLVISDVLIEEDSIHIDISLENKSGHKLPSGYPSRKIMLEFTVRNLNGDTIFHSGGFDENGRINGELDDEFEMHYTDIYTEDEVQLYEYVMGNEAGEPTTILTRAYSALKDNRLPPLGFSVDHASYDTVKIVGNALNDPNFNFENTIEGSGKDIIHYHIPIDAGFSGALVNVKVHYISIPRKWLDTLFENDVEEINSFENMYENIDIESVIMQEEQQWVGVSSMNEIELSSVIVFPNPSNDIVFVSSLERNIVSISILNMEGSTISKVAISGKEKVRVDLPYSKGKYFLLIELAGGTNVIKSVLKL